ncbi:MAG: ABC transporter permease [Thermoguttaceae bacterium]
MIIDLSSAVPFLQWLPGAFLDWLLVIFLLVLGATTVGWLIAALRSGPKKAFSRMAHAWRGVIGDLPAISPRRVSALSWLAVKESIRRRVVVVFAIFILILLYAGWFLDPKSTNPALLYLSFVLTATSYLVLLMALFLSTLSLPADIKNRTLHTIVTKPVRAAEIVLGRMIGFTIVGTFLLVIMGMICYVFVLRGLWHTHELNTDSLQRVEVVDEGKTVLTGYTSFANHHRHKADIISVDGEHYQGRTKSEQGHWHRIAVKKEGDKLGCKVGPPEGMFMARVPLYGKLFFLDRSGVPAEKGINVGKEWTYRSYIEGGSLAAAIWTFQGITEKEFSKGIPIEMTISVFRTYKGDIEKGIPGSLSLRNPKTGKTVEVRPFTAQEYAIDRQFIPRKIISPKGEKLDLFKDFVSDGTVQVCLRCLAPAQYFGAAPADLYIRASDSFFTWNFIKGYYGIWLQMTVLIALGVMFSTFLSGPVALLATSGMMLGGFFQQFLYEVATQHTIEGGKFYGGGPFESILRMITQHNITTDMAPGLGITVMQTLDRLAEPVLLVMATILPDFSRFSFADYVAYGFNIPGNQLLKFTLCMLAYVGPMFVAAYYFLKTREVAQ